MSVIVNDILTDVSYRRAEDGIPANAAEQARRIKFVGQAYRSIVRSNDYWFLQKVYPTKTTAGLEYYTLPSDYREMTEVRVDRKLRIRKSDQTAFNTYSYPPISAPFADGYSSSQWYYIYNNTIHLISSPPVTPVAIDVTSITVTDTTATVITTTEHSFRAADYVEIAGSSISELNGDKQVQVVDSTTFTYTVTAGTSGDTGSITATQDNFILKYYYWPTVSFTVLADTIDIPDEYQDAVSAYVFARLAQLDGERGDASDGFDEYNEVVGEMNKENTRKNLVNTTYGYSYY